MAVIEICLRRIRPKWFVILGFIHELVEKLGRGYRSTQYPRSFTREDLVSAYPAIILPPQNPAYKYGIYHVQIDVNKLA